MSKSHNQFEIQDRRRIVQGRLVVIVSCTLALLSLFGGYMLSKNVSKKIDLENRSEFLTHVQTIARLVDASDIAALTATSDDLTSPIYLKVKNMLYDLHDINSGARFLYFMRADETKTKLVFLVDSENPDSKDYSWPGQMYDSTSPLELSNYINTVPFTEGPYTDDWGTWVSSYVPIWYQGEHVGILGMDISADKWMERVNAFQSIIYIASGICALAFILLGLYLRRSIMAVLAQQRASTHILREKEKIDDLIEKAKVGVITLFPKTGESFPEHATIVFNKAMYALTEISENTPLTNEVFINSLKSESARMFQESLTAALEKRAHEFTLTIETINSCQLLFNGSIQYGLNKKPVRISGIAQEVYGSKC